MIGLCVGLDNDNYAEIINTVKADVFKVNPAFNPSKTEEIARLLNDKAIPWIYDAKLGDVTHTNAYYAKYVYEELGASGVTLNPYLGLKSLQPFFNYKDKVNYLLCKTTNPDVKPAQEVMYDSLLEFAKTNSNVGLVHSSEGIENMQALTLCPGIGVQGGRIKAKQNVLYSISRSIINADNPRKASLEYYIQIHSNLVYCKLLDGGYIKNGDFVLSSGIRSNMYIDLKEITKDIQLFKKIIELLSMLVSSDNVLGIESGSISIATGIAIERDCGFGFIRKALKDYATKKLVEGELDPNKSTTIVDDVLTTGNSVLKAIENARAYNVNEVVVVVERGNKGRKLLESKGYIVKSLIQVA